jgi:hypothetical protein
MAKAKTKTVKKVQKRKSGPFKGEPIYNENGVGVRFFHSWESKDVKFLQEELKKVLTTESTINSALKDEINSRIEKLEIAKKEILRLLNVENDLRNQLTDLANRVSKETSLRLKNQETIDNLPRWVVWLFESNY